MNERNNEIHENIKNYGFHVYEVLGGPTPSWIYSIGLRDILGYEIILAGGAVIGSDDRLELFYQVIHLLEKEMVPASDVVGSEFSLHCVSRSWPDELFLGAIDYYGERPDFIQIIPHQISGMIDVPRLMEPWSIDIFPAWKWLEEDWKFPVSERSVVVTDVGILSGNSEAIVACRFSDDYWEVYSKDPAEVGEDDAFIVPLGVLLATQKGIFDIVDMKIKQAIERENSQSDWEEMEFRGGESD